jgi:hypothetical protein
MKVSIDGVELKISDRLYSMSRTLKNMQAECAMYNDLMNVKDLAGLDQSAIDVETAKIGNTKYDCIPLDDTGFTLDMIKLISNIAEEHAGAVYPGKDQPFIAESRSHNCLGGWEVALLEFSLPTIKMLNRIAAYFDNDELVFLFTAHIYNLVEFLSDKDIQYLFDAEPLTEEQMQEAKKQNDMWIGLPASYDYDAIIESKNIPWLKRVHIS